MGLFSGITKILSPVTKVASSVLGGDFLGGISSVLGGLEQREAASAAAAKQMDFQQYNSDTAVRRRVVDLMAAGLNPMLAYSDSASTPTGSSYTPENVTLGAAQTDATAANAKQATAQIDNIKTQSDLNRALITKAGADSTNATAQAANAAAQAANTRLSTVKGTLDLPRATNDSKFNDTWYGRNIRPAISDVFGGASTAAKFR